MRFDGKSVPISNLNGASVLQLCAIGNPDNFHRTLQRLEMTIAATKVFPDHHQFTRDELESVGELAQSSGATAVVCTHKDLVKIGTNQIGAIPVYALLIDMEFLTGQEELERQLDLFCP